MNEAAEYQRVARRRRALLLVGVAAAVAVLVWLVVLVLSRDSAPRLTDGPQQGHSRPSGLPAFHRAAQSGR